MGNKLNVLIGEREHPLSGCVGIRGMNILLALLREMCGPQGVPRPTERSAVAPELSSLPTWADSPLHYLMCDHGRVAHIAPMPQFHTYKIWAHPRVVMRVTCLLVKCLVQCTV